MPVNLELKIELKNHKDVETILKKLKAEKVNEFNQKDIYYKCKSGLLKLRIEEKGESLIKYLRDEKGKNRWSEFEVIHFSENNSEKFFKGILNTEAIVSKKRVLYMYDNTRIHLDKVKGLGYFLELETLMLKDKDDAKKRFDFIARELKLDMKKQIKKSYRDLMLKKAKSK
jgi:adenylate cyclase, class 2